MELNQRRVLDIHDAVEVHVAEKVVSGRIRAGGLRISGLLGGFLSGRSHCGLLSGRRSGSGSLRGLRCGGCYGCGRSGCGLRNRALCHLGSGDHNGSGNAGSGYEI